MADEETKNTAEIEVLLGGEREREEWSDKSRRLKAEVRRRRALGEIITPAVRQQIIDEVASQRDSLRAAKAA